MPTGMVANTGSNTKFLMAMARGCPGPKVVPVLVAATGVAALGALTGFAVGAGVAVAVGAGRTAGGAATLAAQRTDVSTSTAILIVTSSVVAVP